MILRSLILLVLGFGLSIRAETPASCNSRQLKLKSCVLKMKTPTEKMKITLGPTKITWLHGPWRSIVDFPDHKKVASWESVKLTELNDRFLLDVKTWQTSPAELEVETLQWILAEIKGKAFKVHLSKPIGKRKPVSGAKDRFITDQMLSVKVGLNKDKKIEWSAGQEQGVLNDGI